MARILNLIFFFVLGYALAGLNDNPKDKHTFRRWSYWLALISAAGVHTTALLM